MGSSQGKESGIQDYQLWTLTGYIVQTYEDALAKRRSYEDAQNVIVFHLKELSRYALNPKKSPNPDNIYFNRSLTGQQPGSLGGQQPDSTQLIIHEKYRHTDGIHAWSLTIQLTPTLRMFKLIHGTPTIRESTQTETLQSGRPAQTTQHTLYPPSQSRHHNPSSTNRSVKPTQSTVPMTGSVNGSTTGHMNPSRVSNPGTQGFSQIPSIPSHPQPMTNSLARPKGRTALPAHPTLPNDYSQMINGNLRSAPIDYTQRMPMIENDQIASNMGEMSRPNLMNQSNQLTDLSHLPAEGEEFSLNRYM
jgi:hypothetical protein